jgi:hypothetical protein
VPLDRTSITIVLDPELGWELRGLAETMPVHIVDSPTNRPAIESVWTDRRQKRAEGEVTVFRAVPGIRAEDHLAGILSGLLGDRASPPPAGERLRSVHVIGLPLTAAVEVVLHSFGLGSCRSTPAGFRAVVQYRRGDPSAEARKAGS